MLKVSDLSVNYGQHRALEDAALQVGKGEIVVMLGANGAGKTTLLKAIGGICEGKTSGSVTMNGVEMLGRQANEIVEEGLALVPEGRGVFGDLTVQENLTLGAYPERARDEESANLERVFALFPKLHERRRQVVRTMSGGEQQMVAIGRAMMSNPSILALDEPSLGLSPLLCKELFQSLKSVRQSGIGILLVEQNAKQSLAIADRGYLLENGQITHEDSASALMNDPAVQKAYLGGGIAPAKLHKTSPGTVQPAAAIPARADHPAAESPSAIAALAMAKLTKPDRPATVTEKMSEPVTEPAQKPSLAQANWPRKSDPVAAPTAAPTGATHGMDISAMVANAAARSDRRDGAHGANNGRLPTPPAASPSPKNMMPKMPDLGPQTDRLQAALKEIEDAARRAEDYRSARKPA